jgi:S1-C subfamily serine protease
MVLFPFSILYPSPMTRLIGLILFALSSCASAPQLTIQAHLQAHVALFVDTWTGSGSGFPMSSTEVITAWHVVAGVPPSGITINGLHPITSERLGELDAALLTFAEPHGLEPWILDVRPVEPAEPVWCSGWGVGLHWWSEGLGTLDPFRLSLLIAPGDSGCPVLDADMEVIGIVVARGVYSNHHTWIVPITEISAELEALDAERVPDLEPSSE